MDQNIRTAASACMAHLAAEAAYLGEVERVTVEFRQAFRARDQSTADRLIQVVSDLSPHLDRLETNRLVMRATIADVLGLKPNEATVGKLAEKCDAETRIQLDELRAQLQTQARSLNGHLASTGNLAMQLMELNENVFRSLTGQSAQSVVYERTGRARLPRHAA